MFPLYHDCTSHLFIPVMFSKKGKKEGRKGEGRKEWEKGRRWDRKKERKEKERFRIDIALSVMVKMKPY